MILLVVAVLWVCSFNGLMLSAVHPALADSRGWRSFGGRRSSPPPSPWW